MNVIIVYYSALIRLLMVCCFQFRKQYFIKDKLEELRTIKKIKCQLKAVHDATAK